MINLNDIAVVLFKKIIISRSVVLFNPEYSDAAITVPFRFRSDGGTIQIPLRLRNYSNPAPIPELFKYSFDNDTNQIQLRQRNKTDSAPITELFRFGSEIRKLFRFSSIYGTILTTNIYNIVPGSEDYTARSRRRKIGSNSDVIPAPRVGN